MPTPAEIRKEISARLKQARQTAGYASPEDFCSRHNIAIELYNQHETGERSIKASFAQQYCKLLNIKLNWLLLGNQ